MTIRTTHQPDAPDDGPDDGPEDLPLRLRARDHTDLVLLIPYLLGYYPHESLVLSVLDPPGPGHDTAATVGMSARIDLPRPTAEPAGTAAAEIELLDVVRTVIRRQHATEVLLIAYGSDAARCVRVLDRIRFALHSDRSETDRVAVRAALHTDGSRWWSRLGDGPSEGVGYHPDDSPLVARAVLAGRVVRADRAALERSVEGPAPGRYAALRVRAAALDHDGARDHDGAHDHDPDHDAAPAADPGPDPAAVMEAAVAAGLAAVGSEQAGGVGAGARGPGEEDLLRLALLARDVRGRDAALAMIDRRSAGGHADLWHRVVAVSPPELAVAPLCLLGVAAWQRGDGTLLHCCVDRALGLDPGHRLAGLLAGVHEQQLAPDCWPQLSAGHRGRR